MTVARAKTMAKWEVREHADGLVDLHQGRKRQLTDVSYGVAMQYLRSHIGDGHKVLRVESDGYTSDITRAVRRKRAAP